MKLIAPVFLLFWAFGAVLCSAQRSLDYFVQQAFANDPAIGEFDRQRLSASLDSQQVVAQYRRPYIDATGNVTLAPFFSAKGIEITPYPSENAVGFDPALSNGAVYSALINVTLPIWNRKNIQPLFDQWPVQSRMRSNQIALKKRELRKAVADQYVLTLAVQERFPVSDSLQTLLNTEIEILEKLVRAGLATVIDLENLRLERDNERIARLQTEAEYARNLTQIYLLTGGTDTARVVLTADGLAFAAAGKPVAMYEKFRLDSLTAQNQQSVFETRYGANFSLGASAGLNATQLSDAYRRFGLQGSINFRQPLYDGHQRQLTRSQTRISLETIAVYRNAFDRQRQKNLDADLAQLRSLDGLLLAYDGQAEAYRRLLGYTRRLTGKGLPYSSIDVLNVVRQSKQVEMNRIQVRTNRRLAINDLNFWQE